MIIKNFPNSFLQTELESKLRENGVTKVVVVGMMTHMCIDATVRAAVDLGFETTLIEDACATLDLSYEGKVVPAEQVHYAFVSARSEERRVGKGCVTRGGMKSAVL